MEKPGRTGGPVKCKQCGRQFVTHRQHPPLSNECKRPVRRWGIELLLAECISLEGICRVPEIKPHQLYSYMDELYGEVPADLACSVSEYTHLELFTIDCETDELWSFVGCQVSRCLWVIGARRVRWVCGKPYLNDIGNTPRFIPTIGRLIRAFCSLTVTFIASKRSIPHRRPGNHVERLFCTLRQRASRLVRLSLSFSKKLERHTNSIKFMVTFYNLSLQT